jgi:hypothetical protein
MLFRPVCPLMKTSLSIDMTNAAHALKLLTHHNHIVSGKGVKPVCCVKNSKAKSRMQILLVKRCLICQRFVHTVLKADNIPFFRSEYLLD